MKTDDLASPSLSSGFPFPLAKDDHAFFQREIHARVGIVLGWNKSPMMARRLSQRLRILGLPDFSSYRQLLERDPASPEWQHVVNAVTTNKTAFFREIHHFKLLERALAELGRQGVRQIRLWSAACSTGEEPYSMAMTAHHALRGMNVDLKILATDIDDEILEAAKTGQYDADALEAIPKFGRRYIRMNDDGGFEITNEIRDLVTFRIHNLVSDHWPMNGPYEFIFCRNVLIYFDRQDQFKILSKMMTLLRNTGQLCLGHAESLPPELRSLPRGSVPNTYLVPVAQSAGEVK